MNLFSVLPQDYSARYSIQSWKLLLLNVFVWAIALKWLTFCKTFTGKRLQIVDMVMWSICPPSPLVVLVYPPVYGSQSGGELTFCGVSDGSARCGRQYPPVCLSIACPVRLFPLVPLVGQPATVLRVCPHSQTNFASFNIAWSSFRGCKVRGMEYTHAHTHTWA